MTADVLSESELTTAVIDRRYSWVSTGQDDLNAAVSRAPL
jgi:hypothetical protein